MNIYELTGDWDYKTLPANIIVGKNCWLERKDSFARVRSVRQPGLVLGDGVHVYMWTAFSIDPEGLVEVGDGSALVGAIFMCAQHISIGKRVVISYHVTIADSDFHPKDPDLRKQDAIANAPQGDKSQRPFVLSKPVKIDDDVHIGIGAFILKGVHVGQGAKIGAGAVVTMDVPPGARVEGNPGRIIH